MNYNALSAIQKARFISRIQNFIAHKTFKIHDTKGYKEMPVLISAAAIQLTFGLKKYLLPNFEFIHVYPREFMRIKNTICFLEGNVSGHTINLSWKHFLEGYAIPDDGQNVGLHRAFGGHHIHPFQHVVHGTDQRVNAAYAVRMRRNGTSVGEHAVKRCANSAGAYDARTARMNAHNLVFVRPTRHKLLDIALL